MIRYRRDVPPGETAALVATAAHIRAHLSAVADPDDNPKRFASRVQIDVDPRPDPKSGLITLVGSLDAVPRCAYLTDDYDPDTDDGPVQYHWANGR